MLYYSQYRFLILVPALLGFSFLAQCQSKQDCSGLESGIFYSYPKNTSFKFVTYRENGIAKEYDLVKGDSTTWKVDWKNNCTYAVKYVSGSAKLTPEIAAFVKKHSLYYTIQTVTSDYYIFNGYVDNIKGTSLGADTMWLHEKLNHTPNRMFEQIPNRQALRKAHFSDTSQYALVYLYRPGKFTNSIGEGFVVSFDKLPMAVMANKTGFMFKVFQPGNHTFTSRLGKDESSAVLNVELGKSYYVKSAINWGFHSFRNYKLEMKIMDPAAGKPEFEEVNY